MFPFADNIPKNRWETVTFLIVAINVAAFLWQQSLDDRRQQEVVARWGFVPARVGQLSDRQKVVDVPIEVQGRNFWGQRVLVQKQVQMPADPPQILASAFTCMFLHGGWMHLIGNMWFLLLFGNNIEDRLGHLLYAIFYLVGGLAATAVHWAMDSSSNMPIIGASGAIAAVLGGYAVTYPHARIKTLIIFVFITVVELPAYVFLIFWFGAQLFSGLGTLGGQIDGGVAWWAHVGGFVFGAAVMPLLSQLVPRYDESQPPHENEWQQHGWPVRNDEWPPRF